jgi:hypothetical protein
MSAGFRRSSTSVALGNRRRTDAVLNNANGVQASGAVSAYGSGIAFTRSVPTSIGATAMTRLLLAVLLTTFAGVAVAQTVTVTKETGEVETVQATATTAPREPVRTCLRSTGSRITATQNARAAKDDKPQRCAPVNGRVYTSEDIARTGQVEIYEALRMLDPSIR